MWGVIGGTGFEGLAGFDVEELLPTHTPFGETSSGFKKVSIGGQSCLYIPRHGTHHELLPSEINSCANFYALKAHGVTKVITLSAVGSLRREIRPNDVVVPSQFVNRTIGYRRSTFCGNGIVGHVALGKPVWPEAVDWLRQHVKDFQVAVHFDKIYGCMEGPNFGTQAESRMHQGLAWDILGMTAFPEYTLAREAGMCYIPLCFVTDYDSWAEDLAHVSIEQMLTTFARNREIAFGLLKDILRANISEDLASRKGHIGNCLLSTKEHLSAEQTDLLELLSR